MNSKIINEGTIPEEEIMTNKVRQQAWHRLFKGTQQINQNVPKYLYKYPQVINLLSNALIHIIEGILDQHINVLNDSKIHQMISAQIMSYYLTNINHQNLLSLPSKQDNNCFHQTIEYLSMRDATIKINVEKNIPRFKKRIKLNDKSIKNEL